MLQIILFANRNIFCLGENLQQFLEVITTEMEKFKKWFDRNKLSLHLNQIEIILFGYSALFVRVYVCVTGAAPGTS